MALRGCLILMVATLILLIVPCVWSDKIWENLNLPEEHIALYFYNNPDLDVKCSRDTSCPFKVS